jgi:hypothetical protein
MRHLKEYNELEDLIGDLGSLGYPTKQVGYAINYLIDKESYWYLVVLNFEWEEEKAANLIGYDYGIEVDNLQDVFETLVGDGEIKRFRIIGPLKIKDVKSQVVNFPAGNPYREIKEFEKVFRDINPDDFTTQENEGNTDVNNI